MRLWTLWIKHFHKHQGFCFIEGTIKIVVVMSAVDWWKTREEDWGVRDGRVVCEWVIVGMSEK